MKRAVLTSLLAILPAVALASEATHHDVEHHGIPWATLAFSFINTIIFLFVFFRYLWPFVCNLMGWAWTAELAEERRTRIVTTLEQAAKAKEEAERLKADWERRLAGLKAEIETMRAQAKDEIAREREQILAAARKTADNIRRDAQRAADQEVRNAQAQLREEVAQRALAIARKLATERLTDADKNRFVDDFLRQVNP